MKISLILLYILNRLSLERLAFNDFLLKNITFNSSYHTTLWLFVDGFLKFFVLVKLLTTQWGTWEQNVGFNDLSVVTH